MCVPALCVVIAHSEYWEPLLKIRVSGLLWDLRGSHPWFRFLSYIRKYYLGKSKEKKEHFIEGINYGISTDSMARESNSYMGGTGILLGLQVNTKGSNKNSFQVQSTVYNEKQKCSFNLMQLAKSIIYFKQKISNMSIVAYNMLQKLEIWIKMINNKNKVVFQRYNNKGTECGNEV